MGKWTATRSLTTLWPREILKLKLGWDKKLAVLVDRLVGRELLDPFITKWINLWPSKGYWRETYDKSFEGKSVEEFIDYHIASGWFSGGLAVYAPAAISYFFNSEQKSTPYHLMPGSFGTLADFYVNGKMKKRRSMTEEEYQQLDLVVNAFLDHAEKAIADSQGSKKMWIESEYYRKDVVVDLALGVAAAISVASKERPDIFRNSINDHPRLFEFVERTMPLIASEREDRRKMVEEYMEKVVNDGSYELPELLRAYEKDMPPKAE